jgi:glutathione synthase/RimK-type ligase-like ATP-grasp enzyme
MTNEGETIPLETVEAVYLRAADHATLPEAEEADAAQRIDDVHRRMWEWADRTAARVVNRPGAMTSNGSKPFQGQLIAAAGFLVPDTLVTNVPEAASAFIETHHGRVIYKSVSAVRSVVKRWRAEDSARLHLVRHCPTQFQEWIPGIDVRVHVVGDAVHATEIRSDGDDYRYGGATRLLPIELSPAMSDQCRRLVEGLGLSFAGIDLRLSGEEVYCLEVNPAPAFSYYQVHTGQPIADAVASLLAA